ncbi:DNA helicase [Ranunculus cassubicifolius]
MDDYIPLTSNQPAQTPSKSQNPNSQNPKSSYHIGGIPVEFPHKPYGSQLAFMGRVISTLDKAHKQGHSHALLESPTGTGKTLSLLCSALAWQRNFKSKNLYANFDNGKPNPEAVKDPIGYGGGFVPEIEPSSNLPSETPVPDPSAKDNGNQKKKPIRQIPTIFYASRTHAQISQVIREYHKTSYRVPMAVLGSRKHYCTDKDVSGRENIDEECKLLMKSEPGDQGCFQFRNVNKIISHQSLQRGGCNEAHDIEDLVKVGRAVKGCSYFAARTMAQDAQLVFCPYSYILNPTIRRAMDVDLKRSIDMAREAASVDIEEDALDALQRELELLRLADPSIYTPLHDMIEGLKSWIGRRAQTLVKREFQHYSSCWSGDKATGEFQEAGISQQFFPILRECAVKAVKAASDSETDVATHLSGMSLVVLEGLCSSLCYFFSESGSHAHDYQLVLRRYIKRESGSNSGKLTQCFSLWCMNPAVSFSEIANLSTSVILTSGTLSPMNSFSSELGVKFETCMEAPHVIDVESQVWAAVIPAGRGNCPLNASYKTADRYEFQDALGSSLEDICKIVPGGALVFFPSYNLMEKLCTRWRETGQWGRLNAQKSVFVETRGHQEDFELTLKDYYDSIRQGSTPAAWIKRGKRRGLKHVNVNETPQHSAQGGSAFLAVCRGKVSEGIDFSDEYARVVIIVGIPFPNIHDLKVGQKKNFNDMYKSSKHLLSGSEWYCQQAFRALNQAAGRCIRHRSDYGAIIFMDERYKEERNIAHVSKWVRRSIKKYSTFEMSLEGLQTFFQDAKERSKQNIMDLPKDCDIKEENLPLTEQKNTCKGSGKRKNQAVNLSDPPGGVEVISKNRVKSAKSSRLSNLEGNDDSSLFKFYSKVDVVDLTSGNPNGDMGSCKDYIDLESCNPPRHVKQSHLLATPSPTDTGEELVVKETPGIHDDITPTNSANNENSNSTVVQASSDLSGQLSFYSSPQASSMITPERVHPGIIMDDMKPSFDWSVNSHTEKRRKPMNLHKIEFSPRESSRDVFMDKRLHICCSLCTKSLGLPDNHFLVECSLTSSPKPYLATFLESKSDSTFQVLVSDKSCIDRRLYNDNNRSSGEEESSKHDDTWCENDGCVFRTVFCPFCILPNRVLGLLIVAADSPNVHLLNKILFYLDRLEIKKSEPSIEGEEPQILVSPKVEQVILVNPKVEQVGIGSDRGQVAELTPIERFSYIPVQQSSGGWRTTKSKLKLRKRGMLSNTEDQ